MSEIIMETQSVPYYLDQAGNAITLDDQGVVHRFDHDSGSIEVLASSFGHFVVKCLANET